MEHIPGSLHLILKFPQTRLPVYREKQEAVWPLPGEEDEGILCLV